MNNSKKTDLRIRAEKILSEKGIQDESFYQENLETLIEELNIYQIELEHQNDELRKTQVDLENKNSIFSDLYHNAPVSYFTINEDYEIVNVNNKGAGLFKQDIKSLRNSKFTQYIHPAYQDIYYHHHRKVLSEHKSDSCEIKIQTNYDHTFYIRLESIPTREFQTNEVVIRTAIIDITSEKKMEEENLRRLHILSNISDSVIVTDLDGKITYWNPGAEKIFGYTKIEMLGKTPAILYPDMDPGKLDYDLEKIIAGEDYIGEWKGRNKKGEIVWVHIRTSALYDNNKKLVGFLGVAKDVTKEKLLAEKVKHEAERTKAYFELSGYMMLVLDTEGNIVDINKAGCKILGCKGNECVGQSWVKNFVPDHLQEHNEQGIQKILKQQIDSPYYYEEYIQDKKGNEKLIAWNYTTLKDSDGQVIGLLAAGEDITERKQQEIYKTQLASIVEFSEDGIESMDIDGNILSWNKGAEKIYAYKASEIVGKNAITLYSDDHKKELKQNLQKIKEGKSLRNLITKRKRKNGDIIDVAITFSPLKNSEEQIIGVSVITRDITEQTKVQKALKESELKFETIFEESGNPILIMSKNKIITCNKKFTQLFDYSKEEIIGKSPIYFSPEYQFEDVTSKKLGAEYIKKAFEQGYVSFEWKHMNKKGEIVNAFISLKKIEIEGKAYLISILHDLTEIYEYQKKLKEKSEEILAQNEEYLSLNDELNEINDRLQITNKDLELSENKFRTAFNTSPDAVNINRLSDGLYIDINEGFTRLTGYTEFDVKNKTSKEVNIWANLEDRQVLVKRLQEKGLVSNLEALFRRKDGTIVTGLMSASIIDIDNEKGILSITRDISGRKQLEEELKTSEQRFRQLVEETHAISWEYDILNDQWTYVSPQSKTILNYDPEEWINLEFWTQNIHPEDSSWAVKYCFECANKGENHTLEYRFKTKKGNYVWLRDVVSVEMKNEKPAILRGIMIDITETKQAEEKIRRLSKGIDQSPAVCVITDLEGTIEYVNPKFTELTGYSAEEAIGQNPRILKSDYHSKDFYKELWDTIKSGNDFRCEMRNKKKNGEFYWESALISPIKDKNDRITNFIAIKEDITEKKIAEEQIKELYFRNKLATDSYEIGIWDFYIEENKIIWDDNMYKLYGISPDKFEECYEAWQNGLHPDDRERAFQESEDAINGDGEFHTIFRVLWPDKTVRHIQAHAKVIRDKTGKAVRMTGVNWDVTERVERENELRIKDFAIQSSINAISLADLNGKVFYANKAFVNLWGYNNEEEIIGKHISEFAFLKEQVKEVEIILKQGKGYSGETIAVKKNGNKFHIQLSVNHVLSVNGKPLYRMASFVDITKRKKAEKENANLATMVDIAPNAISIHDFEGNFLFTNKRNLQLHGYTKEEFDNLKLKDIDVPESADLIKSRMEEIDQNGEASFEVEHFRKDGSTFPLMMFVKKVDLFGKPAMLSIGTDITERKKAKDELQASLERNKAILEANPDLMFVFSDTGVILDYKADKLNDLYIDPEKFIGENVRDVLPPEIASLTLEKIEAVKKLNKVMEYGYTLTINGKLKYYESRLVAYGNDKFLAIVRDITKAKSNELEIRESEQKLKDAQRIAKLGSWEFDHIQNKLEFSEEANQIFENDDENRDKVENLTFKNLMQFVYPDDREWVEDVFLDSLKNKYHYEIKHRINTQKGNLKYVKEKYRTTFDKQGNPIKTIGIILDITDLKKTEQDLIKSKEKAEESEERYQAFIDQTSDGICRMEFDKPLDSNMDVEKQIDFLYEHSYIAECNQVFAKMYHANSVDELIGRRLIDFHGGKDKKMSRKANRDFILNGYNISNAISEEKTLDGNVAIFRNNTTGILEEGRLVRIWNTQTDVTEEIKLKKELITAKEKAEESDQLKSAFLANMSHEIRTPMNAIRGFSQLMVEVDFPKEKQKKFLEIINTRTQDLLVIIDDIIDISKIEANQLNIAEEEFSLNGLLSELYTDKKSAFKTNTDVDLKLDSDLDSVNNNIIIADKGRLRQVFINLINNAIKFTSQGSISFGYCLEKGVVKFYVKDTGIGIPKESQKLIFDRFRQVDGSSTRKYGGTGLGLNICKQILNLMGGEIWVESEEGKGSTFYFTLPYKPVKKKIKLKAANENYEWSNKNVLIVEDDKVSLYYLCELLEPTKIKMHRANDRKETIEHLQNNNEIDLVLLDINLPGISGNEIIQEIRKFNKSIPVIAQSAYSMDEEIKKSMEYGFNDYVTKPIDSKLLFSIMNKYLNK